MRAAFPPDQVATAARRGSNPPGFRAWAERHFARYFTAEASTFHEWFAAELSAFHQRRGTRLNVLAPRGSAKTTWELAYVVYCAVHRIEPFVILTADSSGQAEKYLETIKTELESNETLAADYPHVAGKGPIWRADAIELRNGVRIEALSTGRKLRGRKHREHRPTLIIVDDPQNLGHINSELQRSRSMAWLQHDVANAGSPTTNILVTGTALHADCIVCQLQRLWPSRLFRAVEQWPDRMDLWREWERLLFNLDDPEREQTASAFYEAHREAMEAGSVVLWPARFPLLTLMRIRSEIGPAAFNFEYQNHPVNPSAQEWPESYFDGDLWFESWPVDDLLTVKAIALDPSKGRRDRKSDYSAIVLVGHHRNGWLYVDADIDRRDVAGITSAVARRIAEFRPDVFALETNAWQELLRSPIEAELADNRLAVNITPVVNTAPKPTRIRRLTQFLHQRRMRFRRGSAGVALLLQQLRDFPAAAHDDGPDALEMAIRSAIEWHNARMDEC